jgi:hypothetical protein
MANPIFTERYKIATNVDRMVYIKSRMSILRPTFWSEHFEKYTIAGLSLKHGMAKAISQKDSKKRWI